jgi:hypothetical protein
MGKRLPPGQVPLTAAERQQRRRDKLREQAIQSLANSHVAAQPSPEQLARALIVEPDGAAYCRELARCCLLAAIWRDSGQPAELPAEARRTVERWVEMSRFLGDRP